MAGKDDFSIHFTEDLEEAVHAARQNEKRKKESEWAFDNYREQKIYGREKGVLFSVVICSRCILSIFRTMRCKCFREKK
ncbi:MAG: hypothetical protein MR316_01075 [Lachnospiraceae bacterium]|nr:hypothetical protein [Lachnospiraceae bacterium]